MKILLLASLIFTPSLFASSTGVRGKVSSQKDCSEKPVMVWLSLDKENYHERLLLMHTEVPVGGSFQFYLKPGNYQLRASDKAGCESFCRITVSKEVLHADVALVKK